MSGLLVIKTNVQPSSEEEFNDWYSRTHLPEIVRVPGFVRGRRYKLSNDIAAFAASADEQRYLAIYELDDLSVLESEPFLRARGWKPSLAPFVFETARATYRLIADETRSGS